MPDVTHERPLDAEVMACGPECVDVSVGDVVWLPRWGEVRRLVLPGDPQEYWQLLESDIVGIIEEE